MHAHAFLLVVLDGRACSVARVGFLLLTHTLKSVFPNQRQTAEQPPTFALGGQSRGAGERLEACECCAGRRPLGAGQGQGDKARLLTSRGAAYEEKALS